MKQILRTELATLAPQIYRSLEQYGTVGAWKDRDHLILRNEPTLSTGQKIVEYAVFRLVDKVRTEYVGTAGTEVEARALARGRGGKEAVVEVQLLLEVKDIVDRINQLEEETAARVRSVAKDMLS